VPAFVQFSVRFDTAGVGHVVEHGLDLGLAPRLALRGLDAFGVERVSGSPLRLPIGGCLEDAPNYRRCWLCWLAIDVTEGPLGVVLAAGGT